MNELVKEIRAIREVLEDELMLPDGPPEIVEGLPVTLHRAIRRAGKRPRPYRPACEALPYMFEAPLPPLPKERQRFDDDDDGDKALRRRRRRG